MCSVEGIQITNFTVTTLHIHSKSPKKYPIRIEGHRGAGHLESENSLKAFQKAIELGIDGVEFDVWLTKDSIPIVVHGLPDGIIEFEGNIKGVIDEIEYETLKTMTLSNGEKIPTLVEVLDICKDKVHLNIELKDSREEVIEAVLSLIEERNMFDQITFSSFNHLQRERLANKVSQKRITTNVTFGFLMAIEEIIFPDYLKTQPGDSINFDIRYFTNNREECVAEIKRAQEKGLKVKFWFPMEYGDEHIFYDDLIKLEVDTIITNKPQTMIEYFSKLTGEIGGHKIKY